MKQADATVQQMKAAPVRALYVCPDENYAAAARGISRSIGREDLLIVAARYLEKHRWEGQRFSGIVVDPECRLSPAQRQGFSNARCCIREDTALIRRKPLQEWVGGDNERMQLRYPLRRFYAELRCASCRSGFLLATGTKHELGLVHACSACGTEYSVPGDPYPRLVEEIDPHASPL